MPSDPRAVFGDTLRELREDAKLTQEALGHKANIHPTEINRLERGRRNPGLLLTLKLADALQVAPSELLRDFR